MYYVCSPELGGNKEYIYIRKATGSKGSDEPAHLHTIARAFPARI